MFRGLYKYSIDAKGRVSIPARLRKHLTPEAQDTFVMTRGKDKCVDLFPLDIWQSDVEAKLLKLNLYNSEDSLFIRMLSQNATDDQLDGQSRILIPQNLKDYAQIEKEVLILGVLKKIELWNPTIYEEYLKQSQTSFGEIAEKVMR